MPDVKIAPYIRNQYLDFNGKPLSGGKLHTFEAGTSTPKTTYSEASGTTENTNPVILDSEGRCQLYLEAGAYKFILTDVNDVPIWTENNVSQDAIATSTTGADITGDVVVNGTLDVLSGGVGIKVGADDQLTTRSDGTAKYGRLACPHFTNSEEPVAGVIMQAEGSENRLYLGGGDSYCNAATEMALFLAGNNTTPVGNVSVYVNSSAMVLYDRDLILTTGSITLNSGGINFSGTLVLDGAVNFLDEIDADAGADIEGAVDIQGVLTLQSELNADAGADIEGAVDIQGALTLQSELDANAGADIEGAVNIEGVLTLQSALTLQSELNFLSPTNSIQIWAGTQNVMRFSWDFVSSSYLLSVGGGAGEVGTTMIRFYTSINNVTEATQKGYMDSDGGLVIGDPTGFSKGYGTINAKAVYDDNVLLTGYVLDRAYNSEFDIREWDKKAKHGERHEQAREFEMRSRLMFNLDEYCNFIKNKKMLPTFEDVESVEDIPSTGTMIQKLWEVVEIQAVHIKQLNDRLRVLENR